MNYIELLSKIYKAYKYDWCKQRGYEMADVDEEIGIKGECYVSLREFIDNEFQDEEYMAELLDNETFAFWQSRDRLKALWIEQEICEYSILQRVNRLLPCPRCGDEMESELAHNSFSRRANIYVCSSCGMLEAVEDACKAEDQSFVKMPFEKWNLITTLIDNASLKDPNIDDILKTIKAKKEYKKWVLSNKKTDD